MANLRSTEKYRNDVRNPLEFEPSSYHVEENESSNWSIVCGLHLSVVWLSAAVCCLWLCLAVCSQLSAACCLLSAAWLCLIVCCLTVWLCLTVCCLLSAVCCLLSDYIWLSAVRLCLTVYCLLSAVWLCLTVYCLLSAAVWLSQSWAGLEAGAGREAARQLSAGLVE